MRSQPTDDPRCTALNGDPSQPLLSSAEGIGSASDRPQVSVIIPFYNRCPLTRKCLAALLPALRFVSAEIVLVDNGSKDETASWLQSLPAEIRILRNEENLGFARACNQGASASRGRHLLFLNNDTEVSPDLIPPLLKAIERPGIGVVGCKLLYPDETIQHAGIEMIRGVPGHPFRHAPADSPAANVGRELDMVTGACLVIRRGLFFALGGFDESFLNGVEDVDLCLRARMAGYRVYYEPRAVALHHEGRTEGRFRHARQNLNLFFSRWGKRFDREGRFQPDESPRLIPAGRGHLSEKRLHVIWEGSQFAVHSLAKVNREFCRRILEQGHFLSLLDPDPVASFPDQSPEWRWLAERRTETPPARGDVWIRHQWPPAFRVSGGMPRVMIQPWEYGSLPREWIGPMRETVDEIWAPTRFVRDCFVRSGLPEDRVFVVPNGVDTRCYRPGVKPYPLKSRKGFRFLFVGGTIWRKGIDILLDAYGKTFTARDDVCLVIKDMGGSTFYRGQTDKAKILEFASTPGNPEIEYLEETILTENDLAGLYAACHCLVHPYRGEGFGLPIAEAMACGLPVIVTGYGAALDFCHEQNAYLIPSREIRFPVKRVGNLETVDFPWVADPDREALRHLLRHVVEHSAEAEDKGRVAARHIAAHFSWDHAVQKGLDRLHALGGNRPRVSFSIRSRPGGSATPRCEEMDLSVIVVASSRASSLRKCLRALHDATSVSFEVVVIWVGTPRAGEEATRKLSKEFPGCRILLCERAPQDDTLRQAVSSAKGSFLCLLTEEIRLLGSWFEGLREHVDAVEDGGVFAPMILNGQGRQGLKLDSHRAVDVAELARHLRQRYRHRRAFVDLPQEACLFFGRPLLERVPLPELHAPGRKSFLRRWCETVSAAGLQNVIAGDVFVFADTPPQRREASPSSGAFRSRAMAEARNGNLREAVSRIVQRIREDPGNVRHPLFLAELFLESDRPREALEILESLPAETGEPHRTTLCGLAHRHLGRGDLARQMAEAVLRNYPRHAPAWRLAGLSAVDAGRGDEAKECFARAIRSDPSWGIPRADLGRLLLSEGKREEARGELEKAFLLSPAEPAVATAYFDILSMFEFPLEAGELFQAALSLYPEDRRLRFLYIALLLRQNHYADAMREIERAMEIFPLDEGMLRSALAVRKHVGPLRVDEHKTSIPSLSACLIVKNEENRICGCIGSLRGLVDEIVLVDTGSTDRTARIAEALGARVVETAWRDDFAAARNVSLSEARGDWVLILDADERISAEDHERIRRLITRHRKKKAAFRLVTRNYTDECGARGWAANDGSYPELEKASGWFPSVKVRLFPRDPRIRFVHPVHEVVEPTIRKLGLPILDGDVPVHHYGRLDQAKLREKGKHYLFLGMKKLDRLGDDETALRELASQAAGIGEYAQALQLWERLLRIRPDDAAAWMNAGFAALRCARFEQAVAHSKRALELDPGMREAALNLAAGHWARGALAGTEEVLERLLAKEKDYPPALCRMAALRFVQGENEAALFLARRLRSLGFDPEGAFRDLAAELRQGGREDLARLLAEHAAGAGEGAAGSGPPALPDKDSSPARRSPGEACRKPEASMPTVPAALP